MFKQYNKKDIKKNEQFHEHDMDKIILYSILKVYIDLT